MRYHHIIDHLELAFGKAVLRDDTLDVAGNPVAGKSPWIRDDGHGVLQASQGRVVPAVKQHGRAVWKDVEDGLRHACVDEVNLVFAWLPALPGLACCRGNMLNHIRYSKW